MIITIRPGNPGISLRLNLKSSIVIILPRDIWEEVLAAEVEEALSPWFDRVAEYNHSYEFGENCPTLVMRRCND